MDTEIQGEAQHDLVPLGRRTNRYQCLTACPLMIRPRVLICTGLWIYVPTKPSCLCPPLHVHIHVLFVQPSAYSWRPGLSWEIVPRTEICRGSESQPDLSSPHLWRGVTGSDQCRGERVQCWALSRQAGWGGGKGQNSWTSRGKAHEVDSVEA